MKSRIVWPLLAALVSLAGCLGNSGSSSDAPTGVAATAGDTSVTVTWNDNSAIDYWLFFANDPTLNTLNWFSLTNNHPFINATSPTTICGQTNGINVYVTLNGRTGTSAGGAGSGDVSAMPRPAGATWTSGAGVGAATTALAYTPLASCPNYGVYVAVGPGGAIHSVTGVPYGDVDWSKATWSQAAWATGTLNPGYNFNGVAGITTSYASSITAPAFRFVAVGDGGASVYSTDGVTWQVGVPANSSTAGNPNNSNLRAVTTAGSLFIAVGDAGEIEASGDGITWTQQGNGVTSSDLHTVLCASATCVALGDNGLMLVSANSGANWSSTVIGTSTLRALAYGNFDLNSDNGGVALINTWVAVGDNGSFAYLPSGSSVWYTGVVQNAGQLVGVAYTSRFAAVDANGNLFTNSAHAGTDVTKTWSSAIATGLNAPIKLLSTGSRLVAIDASGSLVASQ